jgi:hypothetical protein
MKKNRPSNRRYQERAAAVRVIALMNRESRGRLGDMPIGPRLDAELEKLLL